MHAALVSLTLLVASSSELFAPLSEAQRDQARGLIAAMRQTKRGPYAGVLWFCNDGTQQPPRLNGCAEHGGGVMYGVFGPEAQKLFRLGLYGGTVLTALTVDDLAAAGYYRARALVLERYLERVLDGWVLAAAKSYRGFRQDENEAESARRLLIELAAHREMLERDRALLIRLTRALPYGRGAEALADSIRGLAAVIGDADPAFADLRFKIHALPEPADIAEVERYAANRQDELGDKARELAASMRRYYDPAGRLERLRAVRGWLAVKEVRAALDEFLAADPADTPALLTRGAALIEAAGKGLVPTADPRTAERNLLRLHTIALVEELWLGVVADLAQRPLSRRAALATMAILIRSAAVAGLLSERERGAALDRLDGAAQQAATGAYAQEIQGLGRVLEWARARLGQILGAPLMRYGVVEPKAVFVVDDILRSGVLLPLATLYDRMAADAMAQSGGHRLVGLAASVAGWRGENPGIAAGVLRVVDRGGSLAALDRDTIALLHDLPPDLPPVAGVLTIDPPGSLSHVAMLARNLGIPLASVGGDAVAAIMALANQRLVLGVSSRRRVFLAAEAALTAADREKVENLLSSAPTPTSAGALRIDAAALDLKTTRLLALSEISESDAAVRVGPKAAELGRLERLFPDRVANAVVLPFGAFVRHVDSSHDGSPTPLARLREAYARHAADKQDPTRAPGAEAALLAELTRFREAIRTLPFPPGFEKELREGLAQLGRPGSFGVFVRSDTNVEDLKDFTGAGLNLTVANRVAIKDILQAVRDVWMSPFSERSYRWRQRLLANPEHVYPSVVLQRTVPSEISGVLVTADLESGDTRAITVSAGEGVAAVVDGGAPETLVLEPSGGVRLLASSRSPTRKLVPAPPGQGIVLAPSAGEDPLLGTREIAELRALAAEVLVRVPPKEGLPWDIEFGIVRGKAFLMQIRPLKIGRAAAAHPLLVSLDAEGPRSRPVVALDEVLQ